MKSIALIAIGAGLVLSAAPSSAHHSFAMFDQAKNVTFNGTVKEFQFTNPHSWLQVTVPNDKGGVTEWSFEMNTLVGLRRAGWRATTLRPGDKVKVSVHPMRDGSNAGQLISVTLPSGEVLDPQGNGGARPAGARSPAAD